MIFMSMFNDIDWNRRGNEEECISNSEQIRDYAKRFSKEHWTFLGLGDETTLRWESNLTARREVELRSNTDATTISGDMNFTSGSALSRGILQKMKNKEIIHFTAETSHTELLFRIIDFANQLSICGAVSTWSGQPSANEA